ncbi:MAG: ATP-binding protein [Gemmatimonadaceae bacterium]|jgi:PAS domain S-box-containing protein|nr:ATP-binding protein [Gemmatimonadaceae bacterium]
MALPRTTPGSMDAVLDTDESAAVAAAERLEGIFEALPLAVAEFGPALLLARANARYRALVGAFVPRQWRPTAYDAFPNALADLSEEIDAAVERAQSRTRRVAFRAAGGTLQMVELTFVPIPSGGLLIVGTEVTELEALRQALARSVAQLEAIFDVIPEAVRVFDAQGAVVRRNPLAAGEHAGVPIESLRELWRLDLPRRSDGASIFVHEHPAARALRGDTVRGETLVVRRADGDEKVVEVSAAPLPDAAGALVGAVVVERDVTERARLATRLAAEVQRANELYAVVSTEAERLEAQVRERTAEVARLEETRARERRLAAVGQLAAGVMHDVNNALNPIVAAAHLLQLHADKPEKVRDYAQRIARAAETGAATASRVGRFLRMDPHTLSPDATLDLAQVTDEVIAITRPIWAERVGGGVVRLQRLLVPGLVINGLAGEIREALLNLVQNALDAMRGGGTLTVVVRAEGGEAIVEVRDSGTGMTPEVRERALEPFFTTKGANGTGLGLSEVYGVVRRHQGRMEIDSTLGAGTTVRLVFPLSAASAASVAPRAPQVTTPRRVLVVEDNADGRELLRAVLEEEGHQVTDVATIAAAEGMLARVPHAYDVVLTDVGLPDGSGTDLAARVRSRYPALRVGVITGWELTPDTLADAHFALRKPVDAIALLHHVAGRSNGDAGD